MEKTGILLINLGTPADCDKKSVRAYLKQFLSDPRVIDLPAIPRWLLLNLVILPFRPKQSAEAYEQIWTEQGSPLLIYSQELTDKLQNELGKNFVVELGMRYGQPSIDNAIEKLNQRNCDEIIILPLFPQYSSAATGSAIEAALKKLHKQTVIPSIKIISDFYAEPWFIEPFSKIIQTGLNYFTYDCILFSYHGLPVRQIDKAGCPAELCNREQNCPAINQNNRYCYRAQCFATTEALAKALNLETDCYQTCFQSRLGRTPWIKPYTDEILKDLIQKGKKRLAVICPSFTADCLETLEEINMRLQEQWLELGGETFLQIPCLNAEDVWVESLAKLLG